MNLSTHTFILIPIAFYFILFSYKVHCQNYENPAEKYSEVYKKYLNAECPIEENNIKHFVYFSKDRDAIRNHALLTIPQFCGAQIMYSWNQLETGKDQYDFSLILEDYEYLKSYGKKLFIQLQDVTFNPQKNAIPNYLQTMEYDGGATIQVTDEGVPEGWVAKRWNSKVQERFALLLEALGKTFDGKIEGINLQETAIGVSQKQDPSFSPELYSKGLKNNMLSLKKAFPSSTTMQYANFMPDEWLPWDDKGYLRSLYKYGEEIGVGLGGPDLMFTKKGQLNHALALMHESSYTVPLGIAIQDGNYIGKTNNEEIIKDRTNIVPQLHAFAKDFLKVNYMFWVNQEPYFTEDVVPCFSKK
ncbi:MAG: hypothetical protein RH981_00535 [Arenibacter sp.]